MTKEDLNKRLCFSLNKAERLKSKKQIASLFDKGSFFVSTHLKVVCNTTTLSTTYPAQVAFSVSKSNVKRAVDRNLIKRRMREAYRLNKHILYNALSDTNQQMVLMFIYRSKEIKTYQDIETDVVFLLKKVIQPIINCS